MANETTNQELENEVVATVETTVTTESTEAPAATEPVTAKAEKTSSTHVGTVKAVKLNIREKPFRAAKIVSVVSKGEKLTINVERSNESWYCITAKDGTRGYCMKKFVLTTK